MDVSSGAPSVNEQSERLKENKDKTTLWKSSE